MKVKISTNLKNITQEDIDKFNQKEHKFGELGHPDQPVINLNNVSHKVLKIKNDKSEIELLGTPSANFALAIGLSNLMLEPFGFKDDDGTTDIISFNLVKKYK